MHFKAGAAFNGFDSLTENGKEIYLELEERWQLKRLVKEDTRDKG
jgi:hypothetical protein